MSHYLATYIDFIQSIGSLFLLALVVLLTRKLLLDHKKDSYIEDVKIEVDD